MAENKTRICIIGAGPSGMCALYQIKLRGDKGPDVKCYEKQETWNGQWNYTWRTGTDEYGELINGSMYRHLWIIGPKETQEMADYTFKDHFGKALPSYVPRDVMRQYMHGRWTQGKCGDLTQCVDFRHVVTSVDYRPETDDFLVGVTDLKAQCNKKETFTHVIVANGKYCVPDIPEFPGMSSFPGRVMHSHDLRNFNEFKGQAVLIVGSMFSASDIALQLVKFDTATTVICSYRKDPMGINFPNGIEERPQVQNVNSNTVYFADDSSANVDAIILCTGYMYHHPFLNEDLRFDYQMHTHMYPNHLYKGIIWTKAGNNKLFFVGAYYEIFNMPSFVVEGEWIIRYIMREISSEPVTVDEMLKYVDKWQKKFKEIQTINDKIQFRKDAVIELAKDIDYPVEYLAKASDILAQMIKDRTGDIATYRDKSFNSMYTGEASPAPKVKWMENFDDTTEGFIENN